MQSQRNLDEIKRKALELDDISRDEADFILNYDNNRILELVNAAYEVRLKFFGKRMKLNYLINIKSGLCPEDCKYCSQSSISKAPIKVYGIISKEEVLMRVENGIKSKAKRICLVGSGYRLSDEEVEMVALAVSEVLKRHNLEICISGGILSSKQIEKLKNSGVFAINHNINTSANFYPEICTTHTFEERIETLKKIKDAGLSPCSGAIFGMGESLDDVIQVCFEFKKIKPDSIPLNFLVPIPGTPFENYNFLNPHLVLKILALFRFVHPDKEIRISAGRELHLRTLQPLGFMIANSIFVGDYLTTKGQPAMEDLKIIKDLGFEVEGYEVSDFKPEVDFI